MRKYIFVYLIALCISFASYGQEFSGKTISVTSREAASVIAELDENAKICVTGNLMRFLKDIAKEVKALEDYDIKVYLDLSAATTGSKEIEFSECAMLVGIVLPNDITKIGSKAFYECTGLTSITIPDSVTEIGYKAFSETGLTSVTIPTTFELTYSFMRKIGAESCLNLKIIYYGDNVYQYSPSDAY